MNRYLLRVICLLLVPALISVDPDISVSIHTLFQTQTLSSMSIFSGNERLWTLQPVFAGALMNNFMQSVGESRSGGIPIEFPARIRHDASPIRHIVISVLGSRGDVDPFIAIGKELLERGYRVTLLTADPFKESVVRAGLEFGSLATEEEYHRVIENPQLHGSKALQMLMKETAPAIERPYDWIVRNAKSTETLLIANRFAMGAKVASEALGMPFVAAVVTPFSLWSIFAPPRILSIPLLQSVPPMVRRLLFRIADRSLDNIIGPELNRFRKELGLPGKATRILSHWVLSADLVLALFPEWYAALQKDFPAGTFLTGFPVRETSNPLTPELEAFLKSGEPPVVFTAGTANRFSASFFTEAMEASRLGHFRAVFVGPHDQMPKQLIQNIFSTEETSFDLLFPRSIAVVHVGTIGTCVAAVRSGIPQVIWPLTNDQPDNAARLEKLGLGVTIREHTLQGKKIAAVLRKLFGDAAIKGRIAEFKALLARQDAAHEVAADQIERLIRKLPPLQVTKPLPTQRPTPVASLEMPSITAIPTPTPASAPKPVIGSPSALPFSGRVVFITGASSGIGEALAREFARQGAAVALVARRAERLRDLANELKQAGYQALPIVCDVKKPTQVSKAVEKTIKTFGRLDVMVTNAGISVPGPLHEVPLDRLLAIVQANVLGPIYSIRPAIPELIKRGGQIVVIGSPLGFVGMAGHSLYSMTNFAKRGLAESLRGELKPHGVAVTYAAPGYVASELRRRDAEGAFDPSVPDYISPSLLTSAEAAGEKIVAAVRARKSEVILSGYGIAVVYMSRFVWWAVPCVMSIFAKKKNSPLAIKPPAELEKAA